MLGVLQWSHRPFKTIIALLCGIWDSRIAAHLAARVLELKQKGSTSQYPGHKFVITDIRLLSHDRCKVTYGFTENFASSFHSFWLKTIPSGEGILYSEVIEIAPGEE